MSLFQPVIAMGHGNCHVVFTKPEEMFFKLFFGGLGESRMEDEPFLQSFDLSEIAQGPIFNFFNKSTLLLICFNFLTSSTMANRRNPNELPHRNIPRPTSEEQCALLINYVFLVTSMVVLFVHASITYFINTLIIMFHNLSRHCCGFGGSTKRIHKGEV